MTAGRPDLGQRGAGFGQAVGDHRLRGDSMPICAIASRNLQAVLGAVDHLGPRPDQFHAVAGERAGGGERHRGVERGLPAHGRQQGVGLLAGDDLLDHLGGDRLDVGGVREAGVGHDGGGVGIDQDHPVALGAQGLAGLGAGIVELAGLADDDRAGADDEDGGDVGATGHIKASVYRFWRGAGGARIPHDRRGCGLTGESGPDVMRHAGSSDHSGTDRRRRCGIKGCHSGMIRRRNWSNNGTVKAVSPCAGL